MEDDNWDLHAVVRGFSTTTTATAATTTTTTDNTSWGQPFDLDFDFSADWLQDLLEPPTRTESCVQQAELDDLYKPFFVNNPQEQNPNPEKIIFNINPPQNVPISSPHSVLGGLQDLSPEQQVVKHLLPDHQQRKRLFSVKASGSHYTALADLVKNMEKNNLKKVCHVAAENLSSDVWSWRKYGQKPIKGSPYPRGYYRCSTSKGCMARKQVERHRSDPGMFIVTYTAEHNHPTPTHRNSLAGLTRARGHKPAVESPTSGEPKNSPTSPEMSPAAIILPAPAPEISLEEDDDDLFAGLEGFTGGRDVEDDCFSDHFPADLELAWLDTAAASGGGGGG